MHLEELDDQTRSFMLTEFELEESSSIPYRSKNLSHEGNIAFSDLMRQAICQGNEQTLMASLTNPTYWQSTESYDRQGVRRERRINSTQHAERLGLTEFNTWYVRGLAKRLRAEGVIHCQAYRAAQPRWAEHSTCSQHEGQIFLVSDIYQAHRARYWPEPGDPAAFSLPFGPGCHHSIRRYHP